jgi:hypothetical protein
MPLFGGSRDISLFRTMNKELLNERAKKWNQEN